MFNRKQKSNTDNQQNEDNHSALSGDAAHEEGSEIEIKNELYNYYVNDPIALAIYALKAMDQLQVSTPLALLLFRGLITEEFQREDLEIIGIDYAELASIIEAVQENTSYYALKNELNVRAAIREYDKVIRDIIKEESLSEENFNEIRKVLAKFASDNSMTDLKAAYKFISAVQPETVQEFKTKKQNSSSS
ncbi:MAG: hypothetical protein ACKOW9_03100 [Candidatus Paceibacterota bacterium]